MGAASVYNKTSHSCTPLRTFLTCYGHKTQPRQQRNRAIDTTQCTVKPCSQQTNGTELKCSSQPCSQSTSWVVTLTLATNNASCNWVNLVQVNQSINLLKAKGPIGHLHRRSVQFSLFLPWTRLNMQKKQRHKLFSWHGTVVRGGMLVYRPTASIIVGPTHYHCCRINLEIPGF